MTFKIENFSTIGSNSRKGEAPQQFSYESATDNIVTMKADNYFDKAAFQMNANDMIAIIASDGMAFFRVLTSNPVTSSVVVDSNIISNQSSSDNSNSFHDVSKLGDFPVQDNNSITLENGVNYLVYMEGPVTTNKRFILPVTYDKGGSLIYMGAPGMLVWNYENNTEPFLEREGGGSAGVFKFHGFHVVDKSKNVEFFINLGGPSLSNKFEKVIIQNSISEDFKNGPELSNIENLFIENLDVIVGAGITGNDFGVKLFQCEHSVLKNCSLEVTDVNAFPFLINPANNQLEMKSILVKDCNFKRPSSSTTAAIQFENRFQPTEMCVFDNCNSYVNNVISGPGFKQVPDGIVIAIKSANSGAEIEIETLQPHGIDDDQAVMIWGAAASTYNAVNVNVVTRVSATKFTVGIAYTADNYSGYFRRTAHNVDVGSWDQNSAANIIVQNCNGIPNSKSSGAAIVTQNSTLNVIAVVSTFQEISFSAGAIQSPNSSFLRDVFISDYTKLKLKNSSLSDKLFRVSIDLFVDYAAANASDFQVLFRVDNDTTRDSQTFKFTRHATPLNVNVGYTKETYMWVNSGEEVVPFIKQDGGTAITDLLFTDVIFSMEEA